MFGEFFKKLKMMFCYRERMVEKLRGYGVKIVDVWGSCDKFHICYENGRGERYFSSCTARGAILLCTTTRVW